MKIYNPFKKIKRLNEELSDLKLYNSKLEEKIESMKENKEKHKCGAWCNECKHLVKQKQNSIYGVYESKFCMLDNPCKDRKTENE